MDRLLSLHGRCAVVSGGSRGRGQAIVRRLAEAGAAVVLTGRGRQALQRVEAQVAAAGGTAVGVQADVARVEDSQTVIDLAVQRSGRIDILVNNAAVFPACSALEMTEAVWDETVNTDLKGAFFLAQVVARAMIAAGRGGRIINLLSIDAFRPSGTLVAYDAAKAGLWAVTQSLAKELAEHRILVNAVTPGAIITAERIAKLQDGTFVSSQVAPGADRVRQKLQAAVDSGAFAKRLALVPLGRPGYPDDIATAVLFLASDLASYSSGANLTVDGAQSLC